MIFAFSNEGIQWSHDLDLDSVFLTVKDLVQAMAMSSQEVHLPAWNLLLSQRQEILDNHLAQIPVTPNQQGTFELREDVHASAGAQDMDKSSYKLSDLRAIEFFRENPQVELDAVFRPRIDISCHQQPSTTWRWDKEVHPKTPWCCMKRKIRRTLLQQLQ